MNVADRSPYAIGIDGSAGDWAPPMTPDAAAATTNRPDHFMAQDYPIPGAERRQSVEVPAQHESAWADDRQSRSSQLNSFFVVQQLMTRDEGTPARRAWASAISA